MATGEHAGSVSGRVGEKSAAEALEDGESLEEFLSVVKSVESNERLDDCEQDRKVPRLKQESRLMLLCQRDGL